MGRLDGKVALITGGARGIGEACARLFVAQGGRVMLGDVLADDAAKVARSLSADGATARACPLDVTNEAAWNDTVAQTESAFGPVTVLVNNAGVYRRTLLADTTPEEWDWMMDINAKGVYLGARAVLASMQGAGGGSIVNISSVAGLIGGAATAYNASKGAVRLLTKSIAVQYGAQGIRCNSIHPAPIETDMGDLSAPTPEIRKQRIAEIPLLRFGEAEEVANCILFLASDESSYVTGGELVVDGGYTAR